jgi:hypothetical protein
MHRVLGSSNQSMKHANSETAREACGLQRRDVRETVRIRAETRGNRGETGGAAGVDGPSPASAVMRPFVVCFIFETNMCFMCFMFHPVAIIL